MGEIGLTSQIAEVEYELKMRDRVYSRETNRRKQTDNELHLVHMRAVLKTLQWLDGLNLAHPLPRPADLLAALVCIGRMVGPGDKDAGKKELLEVTGNVRSVVIDVITGVPHPVITRIRELHEQALAQLAKEPEQ